MNREKKKRRLLRLLIPCPLWFGREELEEEMIDQEIQETIRSANTKVNSAIATMNGDLDWFLCVTNKEECRSDTS